MDIFSHAVAGAATGTYYGKPILGACVAVIPDLVLGAKRMLTPTKLYDITHSLIFTMVLGYSYWFYMGDGLLFFALLSHLLLDIPTHGTTWAPPLLYPFKNKRFSLGNNEWEWYSTSWFTGLVLTILWSLLWINMS